MTISCVYLGSVLLPVTVGKEEHHHPLKPKHLQIVSFCPMNQQSTDTWKMTPCVNNTDQTCQDHKQPVSQLPDIPESVGALREFFGTSMGWSNNFNGRREWDSAQTM